MAWLRYYLQQVRDRAHDDLPQLNGASKKKQNVMVSRMEEGEWPAPVPHVPHLPSQRTDLQFRQRPWPSLRDGQAAS